MQKSLIVLLTLSSFFIFPQKIIHKEFNSQILESNRNLKTHLPEGYDKERNGKKALKHYKIGSGKMDALNPDSDAFYKNILRISSI